MTKLSFCSTDNRHLVALVNRHLPDVVIVCKSRLKIGSIIGRGTDLFV